MESTSLSARISTAEAVAQLLRDPAGKALLRDAYLTRTPREDAEAFAASAEFAETLRLIGGSVEGLAIADVGAGRGIASFAFVHAGARLVHAIEPDPDDHIGQGAIRELGYSDRIRIVTDAGEQLALPDASVDVVYCRQVLHHARDLRRFLRECARILKPGGVFCACREHVVGNDRELAMFLAAHPVHRLAGGEHAYLVETYLEAIQGAGLRVNRLLRTYDSVICAFPEAGSVAELAALPAMLLKRRWGRLGAWAVLVPGVRQLVFRWINRRPVPGRFYSFFAAKPMKATGAAGSPKFRRWSEAARQTAREWLVGLIYGAVDLYSAVSPIGRGKIRLRVWAAEIGRRLGPVKPRLVRASAAGRVLRLWTCPTSSVGAVLWATARFDAAGIERCIARLSDRPGAVLLDVGAHCGLFSLFPAMSRPGLRVVAIDASPLNLSVLRRNVDGHRDELNAMGSRVETLGIALGEYDGATRFFQADDDSNSSCHPPTRPGGTAIEVPMRRGDSLLAELGLERIDVCKLDVEGAELAVLRGLEHTLRRRAIRWLRMEINRERCDAAGHRPSDLIAQLTACGYGMTMESAALFRRTDWVREDFEFVPADCSDSHGGR